VDRRVEAAARLLPAQHVAALALERRVLDHDVWEELDDGRYRTGSGLEVDAVPR
jgi:hypothetical protein